jgi:hypothetical protein
VSALKKLGFGTSRNAWLRNEYTRYADEQRKSLFMGIARFCHINRPIKGSYLEFGCHGAHTMRLAWDCFHHLFDWHYVAFDSFEGLPEIAKIDEMKIWEKGKLKTTEEEFLRVVTRHGLPRERLTLVKGFYDQTLTDDLRRRLLPQKAAVVYVDCDLYTSTVEVLRFVKDLLQLGTILVFDDWNCFHGDPDRGERLAFCEFREAHPELVFEEFVSTNEAKSFIYLGTKSERAAAARERAARLE